MTIKVGVQIRPQHTTMAELRRAWEAADAMGVDSLWTWDHFFPLFGEADGEHFECYSLLAAMAATTSHATVGAMVSSVGYRNPDLLADQSRTIDHISNGRFVLGIGAGWFERDYDEYGYVFGTVGDRLRALDAALPRIKARWAALNPAPVQSPLPILIGGGGEKVTLRITAEHADAWNGFGPPETYAHKCRVLDEWCDKVGRPREAIERTVSLRGDDVDIAEEFLAAGATHLIYGLDAPFDLAVVERLLALRG